jgi:hypothetical protein
VTRRGAIRVHVRPRLRPIGALLMRDWLAITFGSHVWAWRPLTRSELAHELAHVRQWQQHGPWFPFRYLANSLRAWRAGGDWYRDNRYEREARAGEDLSG